MRAALWIHCLTHLILAFMLNFYLEHLQRHLIQLSGGKAYLPNVTHRAFEWRVFVWLVPFSFVVAAFLMARRGLNPDRYAMFSACSTLLAVGLIAFAVFVTCAPFLYPPLLESPR